MPGGSISSLLSPTSAPPAAAVEPLHSFPPTPSVALRHRPKGWHGLSALTLPWTRPGPCVRREHETLPWTHPRLCVKREREMLLGGCLVAGVRVKGC